MINLKFNFIVVVLLSSSFLCSCKLFIDGVPNICQNPDGRVGQCMSWKTCHNHKNCNVTASVFECHNGHGKRPFVCCIIGSKIVFPDNGEPLAAEDFLTARHAVTVKLSAPILFPDEDGNYNIPSRKSKERTPRFGDQSRAVMLNVADMFPKPKVCGPTSVGNKITNGDEAELGEFPWLVNLEYRNAQNNMEISCAGNIINHRFVLTAAHCVKGRIEREVGQLVSIRAGDHNVETEEDCDNTTCIPRFERFLVIKRIVHEKFTTDEIGRAFFDIALLKTNRKIIYSLTIAPICLPDAINPVPNLRNGLYLRVAGWGADVNVNYTDEKRIVDLPYVDNEECPLEVESEQICAGGLDGKDSCNGDSGGSLCRLTEQGWLVEGIVSYGRNNCGTVMPSVYTRVRSYLPWIHAYVDEN